MVQYRLKTSRQVNKFNDTQPGKGFEHAVRTQGMINTEHGASQKKRRRERYRREYVVHYFATSLIHQVSYDRLNRRPASSSLAFKSL